MNKTFIILTVIVFVGVFLRFYHLGEMPVGFHRDEAFLGYNAYSILKTGKDMSGNFLPLHLKLFLYSPAGYSYFSIPFISIFGLSAFSVRFASALFGSITILVMYFLVKELFAVSKRSLDQSSFWQANKVRASRISLNDGDSGVAPTPVKQANSGFALRYQNDEWMALLSAFFLAISPWHINLSRTATENTVVVFFVSLAVFLYIIWIRKNKWYFLVLSFFSFFTTIFIYQAPRAFLPIFIPLLILLSMKEQVGRKNIFISLALFFVVILIPLFIILSSKDLSLRIRTVSIFSTQETQLTIDEQIRTDGVFHTQVLLTRVFHNKLVMYTQQFLENYFSHFSYNFLFSDKSFPDRYRVPLMGLLYILELPLIFVGVFRLIKEDKRLFVFLIGWISIVPIGSALTFDDIPNLQRTLIVFPALSIVEAFGLFQFIEFFKKNYWLKILSVGLTIIFIYNISFYLHQYYIHALRYRPWYRQDGYKELVVRVNKFLGKNEKAVITNRESAPTIFFLFYSKYSPIEFQKETKSTTMKDFDRINFGKYEFSQEECPLRVGKDGELKKEKNTVFVNSGLCKEISHTGEVQIKRLDDSIVFRIYPNN